MGCILCNLISLAEAKQPFSSEAARQDFFSELIADIVQYHPDLADRIAVKIIANDLKNTGKEIK